MTPTNPLITEARRLSESSPVLREIFKTTGFDLSSIQALNQLPTSVIKFCAFAANNILAFADKIESQEQQLTQYRAMTEAAGLDAQGDQGFLAVGKKLGEQQKEIAQLRASLDAMESEVSRVDSIRQRLQEALDDANGQLGEFFNTPSGAIIKELQAQVEELKAKGDRLYSDYGGLLFKNTKLREACEAIPDLLDALGHTHDAEQLRKALEPPK